MRNVQMNSCPMLGKEPSPKTGIDLELVWESRSIGNASDGAEE
jgi:hypothetical protein